MAQMQVTANVRHISPKVSVVDIGGHVSAAASDALGSAYAAASEGGVKSIILNFSGMEYMNSSGIGLLVTLLVRANRQGQRLLACGLSHHYQDIFALTRLNEAIHLYDTESAAVAAA